MASPGGVSPMRIAIAGYGSRGDVEPLLALGRELQRRGHVVRCAVPPNRLPLAAAAGLGAIAYGPNLDGLSGDGAAGAGPAPNPFAAMIQLVQQFSAATADWAATLEALAEQADMLVTLVGDQGLAANATEYQGIPLVSLHFFPGQTAQLGGALGQVAAEAENTQRVTFGLPEGAPPHRPELELQVYDEICFSAHPAATRVGSAASPCVGALTLELPSADDDEVLEWIASGEPPVYFGFGSNLSVPAEHTVALIDAVCRRLGLRGLICASWSTDRASTDSDRICTVEEVNHALVLPACRAVVHHGGAGTTAAALRAGTPQVILTLGIEDQPLWGSVVTDLGVGTCAAFAETTTDSLAAAISEVLDADHRDRAREVAARMTAASASVERAAHLLEACPRASS